MEIVPPLNRKATIGFYVHQEENSHLRRKHMEEFAAEALMRDDAASCVLFAKKCRQLVVALRSSSTPAA
jgi:hypothetical protein